MASSVEVDKLHTDPSVVKWGYLTKKGADRRNWTHRFFILRSNPDKLYTLEYHKDHKVCYLTIHIFGECYSLSIQNLKKPKGIITLKSCIVSHSNRKNFCLSVKTDAREYLIYGKNQNEADEWKEVIDNCVNPALGEHILQNFLCFVCTWYFVDCFDIYYPELKPKQSKRKKMQGLCSCSIIPYLLLH